MPILRRKNFDETLQEEGRSKIGRRHHYAICLLFRRRSQFLKFLSEAHAQMK